MLALLELLILKPQMDTITSMELKSEIDRLYLINKWNTGHWVVDFSFVVVVIVVTILV